MDVKVKPYKLPDIDILKDKNWPDYQFKTWIPDEIYIVLGQSNKMDKSLNLDQVAKDNVCVYRRPSGGESVILTPNTLVIATTIRVQKLENPRKYFKMANAKIITALSYLGINNLNQKGISDIAIGDKKILGSSVYRTSQVVFYQAILNVSESTDLMEKYLRHPLKEPDYRRGRKHSDFVSSIFKEGYMISIQKIKEKIH
ncbi:MAG: lipoate--protein ligase family protein [Bacteroidetes bacterium]|nr:lipoate--protein ligase family protein [Bacteroidota bacterium]